MKLVTRTALVFLIAGAPWVLAGCPETTEGPKTPDGQMALPGGQPFVPKPGSGQAQYGVQDKPPPGAPQMSPQAAALYQQGMTAFANGDLKQAQALFAQASQADPEAYQAFYSLGVVQEKMGATSSALASYKQAVTIVPKYERAIVAYGLLLANRGDVSKADRYLTEQRGKLPKSAPIVAALAEAKSIQGDTAEAQELAQQALKIDPAHAPAMMTIARDHYRGRRLDLALYALKAILDGSGEDNPARDKDNAEGHLLRAFIWAEQDKRPLAMQAFKHALELRPDLVVARLRYATYLLESGGAFEALPILQKAVQYDAGNLDAHLSLGDAYRLTEQVQLAKAELDWVKSKNPNLPEVYYNLGLLYLLSPKLPGTNEKQAVTAAIASFNKYKDLKGKGADDSDVDELINRATIKKSELEALEKAAKAPQPVKAPTPAPGAKPPTPAPGAKPPAPAPAPGAKPPTPAPAPVPAKTPSKSGG